MAKPTHYNLKTEPIDYIEQITADYPPEIAFHIGNVLKYISRAPHKGDIENDLNKALNYMHRAVRGGWIETQGRSETK